MAFDFLDDIYPTSDAYSEWHTSQTQRNRNKWGSMGMGLNQHDCEDLASEQCIAALIETDRKYENSDFFQKALGGHSRYGSLARKVEHRSGNANEVSTDLLQDQNCLSRESFKETEEQRFEFVSLVSFLTAKEQEILEKRYALRYTLSEIAEELGLSVARVHEICKRSQAQIKEMYLAPIAA
tara:strand:+ start:127 stop:672 length:546 start_codon:yes stop_codon:yes gene_type:complete